MPELWLDERHKVRIIPPPPPPPPKELDPGIVSSWPLPKRDFSRHKPRNSWWLSIKKWAELLGKLNWPVIIGIPLSWIVILLIGWFVWGGRP